jgi:LysM repeat protein
MNEKMNPKDAELANLLQASAENVKPNPAFIAELEDKLKAAHKPAARWTLPDMRSLFTVVGWAGALAVLALALNWAISALAPIGPQPAAGHTPTPTPSVVEQVATPVGEVYDWGGIKVYLAAPLPETPAESPLYVLDPEKRATLADAKTIAAQFGMEGPAYEISSDIPGGENNFLIVDGNQRLQVRSDQYFSYFPDYTRWINGYNAADYPDAEAVAADFLAAKGFGIQYRIERTEMPGAYAAIPLTPKGFPIHYDIFNIAGLTFHFDKNGLFEVDANLVNYAPLDDKKYRILSAKEAFDRLLNPDTNGGGFLSGQAGGPGPAILSWTRPRRENETVTVWGYLTSIPSAEGGAPLVTLDGYTAIGSIVDVVIGSANLFVEAVGQFQTVDGVKVFNVESWKTYDGYEEGIFGALQRDGDNVVIVSDQGAFILPDVPADVPVPSENMHATGVKQGNVFEWKTLDNLPGFGGGGGGGGGYGFYKINLTGTPVPFPTIAPTPVSDAGFPYTVVAGDTCSSIAAAFNVPVDELIALNNLPADCSTLQIGQTLLIPPLDAMPPQEVNVRGILTATIFESPNGDQRLQLGLLNMGPSDDFDTFYYYLLEGDSLDPLQEYVGRPVDIRGTLGAVDGVVSINVERFEIPFPDLQYQILRGIEHLVEVDGQNVLLFTDDSGGQYVELGPNCYDPIGEESVTGTGRVDEPILLEALAVPGLTHGGYPALCVFSTSMAINPKNNQPMELTITADQIGILPEPPSAEAGNLPTLTIEKVELVYYIPNQRYLPADPTRGPIYLQPAWRFYGHYSDGSIFEALVQALDPIFLLPEVEEYMPPG